MGRGVRTVQRWEQELGLPVRRPRGKTRSAVIAFRNELDQWLQHTPSEVTAGSHHPAADGASKPVIQLHDNTAQLIARTQLLLNRSNELCERMKEIRDKVSHGVELMTIQVERNAKSNHMVFVKSSPRKTELPAKGPAPAS